jgi:hypothetical protein
VAGTIGVVSTAAHGLPAIERSRSRVPPVLSPSPAARLSSPGTVSPMRRPAM